MPRLWREAHAFLCGRSPTYKAGRKSVVRSGRQRAGTLPGEPATSGDRMAGHSQFKNIMHRKGAADARRSKVFSKLAREITVAAKIGTPDPGDEPAAPARHPERPRREHAARTISSAPSRRRSAATPRTTRRCATRATVPAASPSSSRRSPTTATAPPAPSAPTSPRTAARSARPARSSFMFDRVGQIVYRPRPAPPTRCSRPRSMPAPTT